jgi:hypothetical protein
MTTRTGTCAICGRPVTAHFAPDNTFVGCLPIAPMTVTLPDGSTVLLRTVADAYRVAALARKAA